MSNKSEMNEIIVKLKNEVRKLRKENKENGEALSGMPFFAIGVGLDREGKFNLVKLKFDLEKGSGTVMEVINKSISRDKIAITARNAIVDEVIKLSKVKNKKGVSYE